MASTLSTERYLAELAVQRASILTKKVLSSVNKGSLSKSDSTPVTIADFGAQTLLISAIHGVFPFDTFVGEESADALRNDEKLCNRVWELVQSTRLEDEESDAMLVSPKDVEEMLKLIDLGGKGKGGREGRVWMLDPVDGTATFLKGEQYAVSLALVIDGKEVLGVLGCPSLKVLSGQVRDNFVDSEGMGLMLSAVKDKGTVVRTMGQGALLPARNIERGSNHKKLRDLHFVDHKDSKSQHEKVRYIASELGAKHPGIEIWSSHMRYVALVLGDGDLQMRIPLGRDRFSYVWDHAGSQLIFTETGGKVTDLEGRDIDFGVGRELTNNWGLLAAKDRVHGQVLEIVKRILKNG
ncbi:hypothetical protein B7494_g4861 [Chlorociboria aeruginascens]|nr:hypothetical protein B7494_g4861 [Chlorociboria aeruginascens]